MYVYIVENIYKQCRISPPVPFLTGTLSSGRHKPETAWQLAFSRKDMLTLQANGDGKLKWYADASFADETTMISISWSAGVCWGNMLERYSNDVHYCNGRFFQ
jgi:hypothetical protein